MNTEISKSDDGKKLFAITGHLASVVVIGDEQSIGNAIRLLHQAIVELETRVKVAEAAKGK